MKVLLHIQNNHSTKNGFGNLDLVSAHIMNLRAANPNAQIVVIATNKGVGALLASYGVPSDRIAKEVAAGVIFLACARGEEAGRGALVAGARYIDNGIGEIVRLVAEGWPLVSCAV